MSEDFGIKNINKIIKSQIPRDTTISLVGPPNKYKKNIINNFIFEGITSSEPTVLLSMEKKASKIEKEILEKVSPESTSSLEIVDCHSWKLNSQYKKTKNYSLKGPNLNELLHVYIKVRENIGDGGRTILNSFNLLTSFGKVEIIYNFLQTLIAKDNENNNLLLLIGQSEYKSEITDLIKSCSPNLIEIRKKYEKPFIKIHWMAENDYEDGWFELEPIEEDGEKFKVLGPAGEDAKKELNKSSSML